MNGYEFTKFESDFTSVCKARAYEASIVAFQIEYSNPGVDFRKDADYKDAQFWFLETTQSCNRAEAIKWMAYYMSNAIAYGIQTKNKDWRTKFLAAYDLYNGLCPNIDVSKKKRISKKSKKVLDR